jgi:TrmH family RNA methyltransferase
VLIETSHPGNVGAVARAMKNMALEDLVLVRPRQFPHPDAIARASGADDLLERARVVTNLADALAGCGLVVGTTSREREGNFRVLDVREAAARLALGSESGPVAVLFGNERTGLTNEELGACHALLRIPANAAYASLNVAMAAQLVGYEIFRARGARAPARVPEAPLAPPAEMERLYAHLEEVLNEVDFRDRTQSGTHLMTRIRRFMQRAELDVNEVNILRGILTAVQNRRRTAGSPPVRRAP